MDYQIFLADLKKTQNLAKLIKVAISPGLIITLSGELGAGKTALVREIIHAFDPNLRVKSPTFTIVEPYNLNADTTIYHFDLYRFNDPDEWLDAGFDEYFTAKTINLIEWPEKAISLLPSVDWQIDIVAIDKSEQLNEWRGYHFQENSLVYGELSNYKNLDCARFLTIKAKSVKGCECLQQLIMNGAN